MADPAELHASFIACLREIAAGDSVALTVYDGDVDDSPPVDDVEGLVLPYAAVWGSPGADPSEQAVTGPDDALLWTPRATVAAGTQRWCLQAATLVRRAARALVLPGGGQLREPLGYVPPPVQLDRDEDPPRYFLPMEWTALLP